MLNANRAVSNAWGVCNNAGIPGPPYYPWTIKTTWEKGEFVNHMEKASGEAKLVRVDTLRRMHPDLPRMWPNFINGTYAIAWYVRTNLMDRDGMQAWQQWVTWSNLHGKEIHMPPGAKSW